MRKSNCTRIAPAKVSRCHTCGQMIRPGVDELIVLQGRGYRYLPGIESHDGCIWDDRQGPTPFLTWGQVVSIRLAVRGHNLPADVRVDRFLGAVETAFSRRNTSMYREERDAALALGPDLLAGFEAVLTAMGKLTDRVWQPVLSNGATPWEGWQHSRQLQIQPARQEEPTPTIPTQWWVRGTRIVRVEVKEGSTVGQFIEVRRVGQQAWEYAHLRQLHKSLELAQADVQRYQARSAAR